VSGELVHRPSSGFAVPALIDDEGEQDARHFLERFSCIYSIKYSPEHAVRFDIFLARGRSSPSSPGRFTNTVPAR